MNATFSSCAFGSLSRQGVSASTALVKTRNSQVVGTNKCLSLPFRSEASTGAAEGGLWFVPHSSHMLGGCQVNIFWPKCPNASHSWGSGDVCWLVIKRPQWVRESMNFRAGRVFERWPGPTSSFYKQGNWDAERRALPKVKHLVSRGAGSDTFAGSFLPPPSALLVRPDPCSLDIYNRRTPSVHNWRCCT